VFFPNSNQELLDGTSNRLIVQHIDPHWSSTKKSQYHNPLERQMLSRWVSCGQLIRTSTSWSTRSHPWQQDIVLWKIPPLPLWRVRKPYYEIYVYTIIKRIHKITDIYFSLVNQISCTCHIFPSFCFLFFSPRCFFFIFSLNTCCCCCCMCDEPWLGPDDVCDGSVNLMCICIPHFIFSSVKTTYTTWLLLLSHSPIHLSFCFVFRF